MVWLLNSEGMKNCNSTESFCLRKLTIYPNACYLPSYFCLFMKAILQKNLKIRFWNFKLTFLRMQFSLIATFFSLVLVICLGWYLHRKLSHDLLILVSFNIWKYKFTSGAIYLTLWKSNGLSKRLKDQSTRTGPKYKCKVSSCMDSTEVLLRVKLNLGFNLSYFSFLL